VNLLGDEATDKRKMTPRRKQLATKIKKTPTKTLQQRSLQQRRLQEPRGRRNETKLELKMSLILAHAVLNLFILGNKLVWSFFLQTVM